MGRSTERTPVRLRTRDVVTKAPRLPSLALAPSPVGQAHRIVSSQPPWFGWFFCRSLWRPLRGSALAFP